MSKAYVVWDQDEGEVARIMFAANSRERALAYKQEACRVTASITEVEMATDNDQVKTAIQQYKRKRALKKLTPEDIKILGIVE